MAEFQLRKMLDMPASSRASPLPQGAVARMSFRFAGDPVWERACSRKRWLCQINAECAAVFASKLAPTGIGGIRKWRVHLRSTVGASLLAKTQARSMEMVG